MIAPFFSFFFDTRSFPCSEILHAVSISFRDGFVCATYHEVGRLREGKREEERKKVEKVERKEGERVRDTPLVIMVLSEWSANARFVSPWMVAERYDGWMR